MKIINNMFYDQNGNSWSCYTETVESAEVKSQTLLNCRDCHNCLDCHNCRDCRDCLDCRDCHNCLNCRDCRDCCDCHNCLGCRDCLDCRDCRDCLGCRDWESSPQRYVTPSIGSRDAQTTFYFSKDKNQVVCGCFDDSLEAFTAKVSETYSVDSLYFQQYNKQIEIFKYLIEQLWT
jgi:hypothetical protein